MSAKRAFITEIFSRQSVPNDDYNDEQLNTLINKHLTDVPNGQKEYLRACKKCCVIPLSVFHRQLAGVEVSLKFQQLTKNAIKSCAIALMRNKRIRSLDLEGCEVGPEGAKYICEVLRKRKNILHVNLSSNKLGTAGIREIVNVLRKNQHLRELELSHNNLTDNDAIYVKEILESDNHLNGLNLSHNEFSEYGGYLLASGLANNDRLKVLDLSWNHLRGRGAAAIGYSLQENSSLEVLDVSWNGFEVPGCHGLGHGLEKNSCLIELNISSNRVGVTALVKFLEGLKRNSSLQRLKIAENPITAQGPLLILHTVEHIPNIQYIDFGMQPVEEEFMNTLKSYQKKRKLHITHGKVYMKPSYEDGDPTMYINGDPVLIMLEFTRMKEIPVLDLFLAFDTDGSHTLTWDEFKEGVKVSRIPVRTSDLEEIIKRIDINLDGEINFTELTIAQKSHNLRVQKLLARGRTAFEQSEVGLVHKELEKWFHDKDVYLDKYSMFNDERIGGLPMKTT